MVDAVVIGAGPNGLVAANMLADKGWSVTVLEANDTFGGAVRTSQLTIPGFHHDVFSAFYPLAKASPAIGAMKLEEYGLRWRDAPLVLAHPFLDGRCAVISSDVDRTAESVERFAPGDGDAWSAMIDEWRAIEGPALDLILRPMPPVLPALKLARRLGVLGSMRMMRHALLPVRRMAEERFAGEGAAILLGGCSLHADLSPEAAGSGAYGWLLACLGQTVGFPVPEGGAGRLAQALADRLADRGGTIVCGSLVDAVVIEGGRAVGVRTADGRQVRAGRAVLADVAAPKLYRRLVGEGHLPKSVLEDLENFQWDMATIKVDWALDGPVPWAAADARSAGTVHIADDFDNLTEFSAHISMGRLPARPYLLFGQQSVGDPTRSPAGTETAWAYTHIPRRIRGDALGELPVPSDGEDEQWIEGFVERMQSRVEALAPGFTNKILARSILTPRMFERENPSLVGGAIGGGTSQLHQQLVFRPIPGAGRPETPISGLYLASSAAHPGGGVHGAAGANAARAALLPGASFRAATLGRGGRRSQ